MDDEFTLSFKAFDCGLKKGREEGRIKERRRILKEIDLATNSVDSSSDQKEGSEKDANFGWYRCCVHLKEKIEKGGG